MLWCGTLDLLTGWFHILGGSTAQQTDPMPAPILSFWKVPLSLALTQRSQKMAREGPLPGEPGRERI